MADAGIVRNRLKVEAALANARAALPVIEEHGSLAAFFWRFRPEAHEAPRARADWVAASPESTALAKELKKRGFRFVGPTTAYSLMQAAGIVNDHAAGCCVHGEVEAAQLGGGGALRLTARAAARRHLRRPAIPASSTPADLPLAIPRPGPFLVGLRTRQGAAPGDTAHGADRQKEQSQ